jgi:subtilase family serine protease
VAGSRQHLGRRAGRTLLAAAATLAATSLLGTAGANAATVPESVCPPPPAGYARCQAQILVNAATGAVAHPADIGATAPQTGSPAWLQWAYDLEGLSAQGPSGTDTVAIVDPYGYNSAENDLAYFRSTFGLPACTTADGCFEKVNQAGQQSNYPADPSGCSPGSRNCNAGWITETALDLDTISAICPACHLLLVQATTNADADLAAAELTAASLSPQQISNSWSWTGDNNYNNDFDPSNIAVVAATGDGGYNTFGVPAELPHVTAAGGTTLPAGDNARGFAETAWSGTASGCATGVTKPSWQTDTGCASRTVADLSADSDVNTGAIAYDTEVDNGFFAAGGTSVASPLIAAYYALVGGGAGVGGASWAYSHAGALNDITSGVDGTCSPSVAYWCTAEPGYDGPTGEGSVSGDVVAGPPQVGGGYAQSVTATSATLDGGAYANQNDTQVYWQYGTSVGYGQQTAATDAGSAPGATPVSASITDLSPDTEYHFRLVATSSAGTNYGYDNTFFTPSAVTTTSSSTSTSAAQTSTVITVTQTATTSTAPPTTTASTATAALSTSTSTTTTRTVTQTTTVALLVTVGPAAHLHGRQVRVLVRCNRRCAGSVALHVNGRVIGQAKVALGPNGLSKLVALTLNKAGRRLVQAHRTLHAVATLALNGHAIRRAILIV